MEVTVETAGVLETEATYAPGAADVAVLDVRLPDGNGIELCRTLRERDPALRCLMLTSFADDEALDAAVLAGAQGYVLKDIRGSDLVSSVHRVAAGATLLDAATIIAARARSTERTHDTERLGLPQPPGAADPRAPARGALQPRDRRAGLPRREDGQELRVEPAREARLPAAHRGGAVRRAHAAEGAADGRLTSARRRRVAATDAVRVGEQRVGRRRRRRRTSRAAPLRASAPAGARAAGAGPAEGAGAPRRRARTPLRALGGHRARARVEVVAQLHGAPRPSREVEHRRREQRRIGVGDRGEPRRPRPPSRRRGRRRGSRGAARCRRAARRVARRAGRRGARGAPRARPPWPSRRRGARSRRTVPSHRPSTTARRPARSSSRPASE